jgi:beta-glucanase (GH16 family)
MLSLLLSLVMVMGSPTEGRTLVYQDEFNRLRPEWTTRGDQYTSDSLCAKAHPSCARVVDGTLVLSARPDPDRAQSILTGHVGAPTKAYTHGYFEARIKFPILPGLLCGWWLAPSGDYTPDDPATPANERGVEIDIAENGGRRVVHHSVWYRDPGQGAGEFHEPEPTFSTDLGYPKAHADYHTYGVLWTADDYKFYIDGKYVGHLSGGLSTKPSFPVLSAKVPNYLLDAFNWESWREYKMRVKWVRIWQ